MKVLCVILVIIAIYLFAHGQAVPGIIVGILAAACISSEISESPQKIKKGKGEEFDPTVNDISAIHSMVISCYDEEACEFDYNRFWKAAFDNCWDEFPAGEQYIKSELKTVCIGLINNIKWNLFPDLPDSSRETIMSLNIDTINQLPSLIGGNTSPKYESVKAFSDLLREIKFNRALCNRSNIEKLISYGDAVLERNI